MKDKDAYGSSETAHQLFQLNQKIEDAHNELDLLNIPRKDDHNQILTVAGRIKLFREMRDTLDDDYLNSDIYRKVKARMLQVYKDYTDSANCLLLTSLVEDVARHFNTDKWLEDSDHWIWDVASIINEELIEKNLINR